MSQNILKKIKETVKYIASIENFSPKFSIIVGSGITNLEKKFTIIKKIPYPKIPYFLKTTVKGHKGELVLCSYKGIDVLIFSGRFHYYEGFTAEEITYPIRVMSALGVKNLIITAAVGAINTKYSVGDIVVIKDHINFTGYNPLIGTYIEEFGERFSNMENAYNTSLRKIVLHIAKKYKIGVKEGVYIGVSGPSYETSSEVKAFRLLGADVVGMSVVYETIVATQMKINVLGLCFISNMATGSDSTTLNHNDVLKNGETVSYKFSKIITAVIAECKGDL